MCYKYCTGSAPVCYIREDDGGGGLRIGISQSDPMLIQKDTFPAMFSGMCSVRMETSRSVQHIAQCPFQIFPCKHRVEKLAFEGGN